MDNIIKIQDLPVFYLDEGDGEVILILHGWGSKSEKWLSVQQKLVNAGFRVVVPDLPGFGKTPEPFSAWTISDYSKFIHEFTEKLNINKFILAGHSFGGRISIDYAVRYPWQLNKLVLISAAGIIRHKKIRTNIFLIVTKIGSAILSVPILSYLKPFAKRIVHKLTGAQDYKKASSRMQEVMKKILEEDLQIFLPKILQPTLILWGEKDIITPVSDAEILNKEIPDSYMHIFPNQPHVLNLTIPNKLAEHIANFVSQN